MAEYIERSKIFEVWRSIPAPASVTSLSAAIHQSPAADVTPVRHGRWLDNEDYMFCSRCGMQWYYFDNDTQDFMYCPNCGCKLDLEE